MERYNVFLDSKTQNSHEEFKSSKSTYDFNASPKKLSKELLLELLKYNKFI